ncbi:MAG: hypothetical protein HQM08_12615 [Candidatus Riflebacteria bacterium]|nr:hypothetical protein [Candidatus Riflebacteria bacterium]
MKNFKGPGKRKSGFALFLAFSILVGVTFLAFGALEFSSIGLDSGRSVLLETICFQSADGGLERGLAKLRAHFKPFTFEYKISISQYMMILVKVKAENKSEGIDLHSEAIVMERGNIKALKRLSRVDVKNANGREKCGRFLEET